MEPTTTPIITKKLSNMVRLFLFTLQKGVSKKKLLMLKQGKILGKSFNDFVDRHHTALSCKSHDVHVSFVYPLEYEFSCSSSPPHRSSYTPPCHNKDIRHMGRYVRQHSPRGGVYVPMMCENVLANVHRANKKVSYRGSDVVEPLPIMRRRVRITEWEPLFPLSCGEEEDYHVDKAAQEFIDKFYRELMLQKWMAADRFN